MDNSPQLETRGHCGLAGQVVRFAGFLKDRGFRIFQSSVEDAIRSLEITGLHKRDDFVASLRPNLCTNGLEWAQFIDLFDEFWDMRALEEDSPKEGPSGSREVEELRTNGEPLAGVDQQYSTEANDIEEKEWLEEVTYSPVSKVEKKDLASFERRDIQVAQLALKRMMEPFKTTLSRRSRRSRKAGNMDFPRIIRRSLKTGGTPIELFYKEKKRRLKRLIILADVSGSMDRYARFVMPFILGLRGVGSRAEVYVFSTSLTSISFLIRHLSFEKALKRMAREITDWSGGTRIGYSLHQFNQGPGRRLLNRRTVVLILSDGWDLGGKELLRREMETLSRKAYCIMWLNPLAGDPDYQPICQGMRVVLPYVDHFLPADSLRSLKQVGRVLSKVVAH